MKTIINHLAEPIISATPQDRDTKTVMYVYSDAVTVCDCGKDLVLSQRAFGNPTYTGSCSCGLKWSLLNGKFKTD